MNTANALAAFAATLPSQQLQLHAVLLTVSILTRLWNHLLYKNNGQVPQELPAQVVSFLLAALRTVLTNITTGDIHSLWEVLSPQIPTWSSPLLEEPVDN